MSFAIITCLIGASSHSRFFFSKNDELCMCSAARRPSKQFCDHAPASLPPTQQLFEEWQREEMRKVLSSAYLFSSTRECVIIYKYWAKTKSQRFEQRDSGVIMISGNHQSFPFIFTLFAGNLLPLGIGHLPWYLYLAGTLSLEASSLFRQVPSIIIGSIVCLLFIYDFVASEFECLKNEAIVSGHQKKQKYSFE